MPRERSAIPGPESRSDELSRAVRVEGRVQGVGFRWWTVRAAESLGLRGWVRNLPDGAVEVHFAGSREVVERMEAALCHGPGGARVDRVAGHGDATALPEKGFEIR
jgi:acylphosphatase